MSKPWSNTNVLSLFPTLVWRFELEDDRRDRINAAILESLANERPDNHLEGWQSPHQLHRRPELGEFANTIEQAMHGVLVFSKTAMTEIRLTGCWANVNPPGAAHPRHSHPNNYLSGVYYVRVPVGADSIAFHDPRAQASIIRPPVTELTATNADLVVVEVAAGTLLLFPSFIEHSVAANSGDAERISVSFNAMFTNTEALAMPGWGDEG